MEREETAVRQVKRNLYACGELLINGNTSVWDRLKSYSTSLIVVNSDKTFSKDDSRILRAIQNEVDNGKLVDNYMSILSQLNEEAAEIIKLIYFEDISIEDVSIIMSMAERTVQRILRDTIHQIAVLDHDIDYSIYDLKQYLSQRNKLANTLKKSVQLILLNSKDGVIEKILERFCKPISKKKLLDFYNSRSDEFTQYEKRQIQQAIYIIAYCHEDIHIDDELFIELMKRARVGDTKIAQILEFKHGDKPA